MSDAEQWQTVCPRSEISPGDRRVVRTPTGDRVVVFCNKNDELRAVDDVCPHEGYPLSEGEVDGETLTCCWHAFRFDLRSGACLKGDEAVRVFDVRTHEGLVQIETRATPVAEDLAARWISLEDGRFAGRLGQVVRDVTRLQAAGVAPAELLHWVVALDARVGAWGVTHVLPVAADVLTWLPRHTDEDALLAILQPFELAVESHVRRTPRPMFVADACEIDALEAALGALTEAANASGAEALLRAVLEAGAEIEPVRRCLYRLSGAHFVDIGHHLIFLNKAFELLETLGWAAAADVLPGMWASLVDGTRYDTLPRWKWLRGRLAALESQLPVLWNRAQAMGPEAPVDWAVREDLVRALGGGDRDAMLDALLAALESGPGLPTVIDALVLAGAERVLRFDTAHDADRSLSHDWLDVTHGFTYASALRMALRYTESPDVLRHVLFAARQIHALSVLDGPEPKAPAGDVSSQADVASGVVSAQERTAIEHDILHHPWARPIVQAHFIKWATAAFAEAEHLADARPLAALNRLLVAPIQQRRLNQRVFEARRLVLEGKVPRTRL